MNDKYFVPGLVLLLLGIFLGMITPALWCFVCENNNKFTCCCPIIFNSALIISGVCLIVIANT